MRTATATLMLACLGLAACSPPATPDEERRPAPQADGQAQPRSAIVRNAEAYKERARSAEAASLEAADAQRAEIDAQTR